MNKKWLISGLLAILLVLGISQAWWIPTALLYFSAEMTPIFFYGKVVDEKGAPIAGAKVEIGVADRMFQDGSQYTRTTDADGLFSLWAHGLALGATVSKDGYYRLPKSSQNYGYAAGQSSDGPKPTRDHPAIFVLRKKGAGVALILKSVTAPLPQDGTPVEVDLETGKVVASGAGNFRIERWSNYNPQDANAPYAWGYRISVPEGGLITRTDDLDFMAPADGYQPLEEKTFTAEQRPYIRSLEKQYFVKLRNGKFARIAVHIPAVNILSYINPTPGDRNLESDSK